MFLLVRVCVVRCGVCVCGVLVEGGGQSLVPSKLQGSDVGPTSVTTTWARCARTLRPHIAPAHCAVLPSQQMLGLSLA